MRRRTLWIVVAAVALFALSDAPQWTMDALFFPWRFADPPLLGTWHGRMRTGDGDQLEVEFTLVRAVTNDREGVVCYRCPQIEGRATTRNTRGELRRYTVSGTPTDRAGHQLHFGLQPEQQPPPDGLEFSSVEGTWDGESTLTLMAEFHWRRGPSAISSSDDPATRPVPLRLVR